MQSPQDLEKLACDTQRAMICCIATGRRLETLRRETDSLTALFAQYGTILNAHEAKYQALSQEEKNYVQQVITRLSDSPFDANYLLRFEQAFANELHKARLNHLDTKQEKIRNYCVILAKKSVDEAMQPQAPKSRGRVASI